jgi:hypothetical protein
MPIICPLQRAREVNVEVVLRPVELSLNSFQFNRQINSDVQAERLRGTNLVVCRGMKIQCLVDHFQNLGIKSAETISRKHEKGDAHCS